MSNLGWYQIIVEISKKVGGPKRLIALLISGGVITGGLLNSGCMKLKKKIVEELNKRKSIEERAIVYTVNSEGRSNEGLEFSVGETFKILETDGDAGLIEKVDDDNSPYFVSLTFLSTISDYKNA